MSGPGVDAHDGGSPLEPRRGIPTEARVFLIMGVFALILAVIYGVTSGPEPAGTVALAAAGVFGLALAVFFTRSLRHVQHDVVVAEEAMEDAEASGVETDDGLYLPETSIWPFFMGLGAALTFAGLAFGLWFIIPGVALLVHAVVGFASQSRDRASV